MRCSIKWTSIEFGEEIEIIDIEISTLSGTLNNSLVFCYTPGKKRTAQALVLFNIFIGILPTRIIPISNSRTNKS